VTPSCRRTVVFNPVSSQLFKQLVSDGQLCVTASQLLPCARYVPNLVQTLVNRTVLLHLLYCKRLLHVYKFMYSCSAQCYIVSNVCTVHILRHWYTADLCTLDAACTVRFCTVQCTVLCIQLSQVQTCCSLSRRKLLSCTDINIIFKEPDNR